MSVSFLGTSGGEELWRYCITDTDSVLGLALGAMFVREAFNGDSKNKVSVGNYGDIVSQIQTVY